MSLQLLFILHTTCSTTISNIFNLELIYCFTYFSPSSHSIVVCFFPVGLSLLIQHFQQILWALKFLLYDRRNFNTHKTCLKNVVLTTKGLQERNVQLLDET